MPTIHLHGTQDSVQYPYTPTVYHYQQVYPPGEAVLKVEAFDYFAFSVLQLTGLDETGVEIRSIHIDDAIPLLTEMRGDPQYPLRLAKGCSISMLLGTYPRSTADRLPGWGAQLQPKKVVLTTRRGLVVLDMVV